MGFRDHLVAWLDQFFPGQVGEDLDYGQNTYDRSRVWEPLGVRLMWDSTPERAGRLHDGRCFLAIPGQALDSLGAADLLVLVKVLVNQFWFKSTRTDVAYDDGSRLIEPHAVYDAALAGNFTGYKRFQHHCPMRLNGEREGDMVTFGTRGRDGSGKYLRVYDKAKESEGTNNAVRWEVEFSKERARLVFFNLSRCETVGELAELLAGLVGASIDFIDRAERPHEPNLDRLDRLGWWSQIRERLGAVAIRNPSRVLVVEKAKLWVEKAVAATLGMLREAVGPAEFSEWLLGVAAHGAGRLRSRQVGALEVFWQHSQGRETWCRGRQQQPADRSTQAVEASSGRG